MKAHPDAIPLMGLPPVKATAWNHAPPLPCGTSSQSLQPHLEDCTTYYPPRNSDGNPDSPQVVVFLATIVDVTVGS